MFCFSIRCSLLFKVGHLYDTINWHIGAIPVDVPFVEYLDPNQIYMEKKDLLLISYTLLFKKRWCVLNPNGNNFCEIISLRSARVARL